jgi:translation initiation factor IF-2
MRVYELAKKLGVENKEALEALNGLGLDLGSVHAAVTDEDAERLAAALGKAAGTKPAKAAKKATQKKVTKKAAEKKPATKKAAEKKPAAKKATKKAPAPKAAQPAAEKAAKPAPKQPLAPPKAPERKAEKPKPEKPADKPAATPVAQEPEKAAEKPEAAPVAKKPEKAAEPPPEPAAPTLDPTAEPLAIEDGITVKELADKLDIKAADVMRVLMAQGVMANINASLEADVAVSIVESLGGRARVLRADEQLLADEDATREEPTDVQLRPPVVTIMGHVDHGKTLLLDAIRQTDVAEGEAGGITQHIGASSVVHDGRRITFIDTPGHEAFTRMRLRGAQVTDIVILVVAADDGVMPQTVEAIDHARAAGVPIIVAINKIDRPNANVDRVKQQLADRGLAPEGWGGDVVTVEVSAKLKQNLELLLEMIGLTAELLELKASPSVPAQGTVLEARLDRQRGAIATLLVEEGTLGVGDNLIIGMESGKVRAMTDDHGKSLKEAGPSTAVEVLGLGGVPEAGDRFQVVEATALARKVSEIRQERQRRESLSGGSRLTLEDLHAQLRQGELKEMPVLIKADVQGSVEVLRDSLSKLSGDKVEVKIIHAAAGGITESDVLLASASNAIIVGFNVRPSRGVAEIASREGVELRLYTVIYQLLDEFKAAMLGRLEPEFKEKSLGAAEVRDTFRIPRVGAIAGCYITEGKITRDAKVRLVRDSVIVFEGRVGSLRRFKDDVPEVQQGYECGIGISNFNDVKVGDVIEAYELREIRAEL